MSQELKSVYHKLIENITKSDTVDINQLFSEDRQNLKSPGDKDKRRSERIELEELFIAVRPDEFSSFSALLTQFSNGTRRCSNTEENSGVLPLI